MAHRLRRSRQRLGARLGHGAIRERELALGAWKQARAAFSFGQDVATTLVHSDQDSVFTSYDWLRALLLHSGARVSCSENGARDNLWIECFWARFKHENHSRFLEAATLAELRRLVDQ